MNDGAWIRPPRGTYRNMTTAPEMSRHTPDRNAGVLSGHVLLWPVNAPAQPAAGVDLAVAIRPQPAGPERFAVRRSLLARPVSAVGLTTRQCRGAGGGHQAVYAIDLQGQETGAAAAAQQNGQKQEAEREDRETASRREKAQAKGERRCVSTGFLRPAGPPAFSGVAHNRLSHCQPASGH
ncbi:hypothetical protein D8B20_20130 (plasmid) [Candidatus Pantoea soli]|uniref:Uncharacterized protein n=1 Tax=Candidatus Pantoea soli TaxID=3098669 RepID=A0A518XJ80_9GAMM|nr:hypothetical protein D8B20_20130 [Pantoea soli]